LAASCKETRNNGSQICHIRKTLEEHTRCEDSTLEQPNSGEENKNPIETRNRGLTLKYMERLSVGACTSTCSEATASSITALTSRLPLLPHPYRTVENLLPRLETEQQEEEEEEEEEVKREEQEAEAAAEALLA
jgi:hypothetical protein